MDANLTKLGSCLLVPSVLELAKEAITEVPPRYVRTDQDHLFIHDDHGASLLRVPVIDLNKLLSSNDDSMESELEKLHVACGDWGFFQSRLAISVLTKIIRSCMMITELLDNHGVSCSLWEEVKLGVQEFFKLPMEEKRKFWQEEGDLKGFGQSFVVSEEQKLDWGDRFNIVDVLDEYSSKLRDLTMKILLLMAKALKMDTKEMTEPFDEDRQAIRMNCYPPCPRPELGIGITPHSDATGLTILLQVNEMEDLQIRKEGKWIVTNGTYRSSEHRATVNSMKERLSIAAFYGPNLEGEIGPAPSLITLDKPALFRRIGVVDYLRGIFARELQRKSYLDLMRTVKGEENKGN
ncbi:hypothetical protein NL676_008577 [Syzygium grande]|nr:hypothetical protein NL676_008577 [Syzygium grande]